MASIRRTVLLAAAVACAAAATVRSGPAIADDAPITNPKWVDAKITGTSRAYLDAIMGFALPAPPTPPDELQWIGSAPLTWDALRGKVVVIQSWTTRTSVGRMWLERIAKLLADHDAADVQVIALHIPDGAENAEKFLERQAPSVPVLLDRTGVFSDLLGIHRQPMNIVVDRNGAIRYAGLTPEGLKGVVAELVAAQPDGTVKPAPLPAGGPAAKPASAATAPTAEFPAHNSAKIHAKNVQGTEAPAVAPATWLTPAPELDGKVVIVDFWATWCGPCIASIPHMNDLSKKFKSDAVVVGISNEDVAEVKRFVTTGTPRMEYSVGADPHPDMGGKLGSWAQVRGIPHVLVISPDGIVRWQGHPGALKEELVQQIVDASREMGGGASGAGGGGGAAGSGRPLWVKPKKS